VIKNLGNFTFVIFNRAAECWYPIFYRPWWLAASVDHEVRCTWASNVSSFA